MAVTCKNCGGAHAIWECKRPATKSTALRLEAATVSQGGRATAGSPKGKEARKQVEALPVDTTSTRVAHKGSAAASAEGVSSILTPGAKFDKKAWSRAYMKIWMRNKRAKLKATTGA